MTGTDAGTSLYGFGRRSPAVDVLDGRQRRLLVAFLVLIVTAAIWVPTAVPVAAGAACAAVLTLVSAFRAWTVLRARGPRGPRPIDAPPVAAADLPRYSLLVPLYGEPNMVRDVAAHLGSLDYPAERLEILLLCEEEDGPTVGAIEDLGLTAPFRLVVCPAGTPRTKPRACNIGLLRATGDLCVVYDAEDRPDPDQLRRAAAAFAVCPPEVVCLQARLDYYNAERNWLTRCFSMEYAVLFRFVLPGLIASGLPVPLGGTSNHFRTDRLRRLGGWDPHNVTEDADLGLRIHRGGLRTLMLDSTTHEEACARLRPWIRQRTRWMKGHLQTWLVHSRGARSGRSRVALNLVIGGGPASATVLPPVGLTVCVPVVLATGWSPVGTAASVAVGLTVAMHGVGITVAHCLPQGWRLWRGVAAMLAYSLLISVATYRAFWQLARHPHLWEKTPHGLYPADGGPAGSG